jgi:hypothetical protein
MENNTQVKELLSQGTCSVIIDNKVCGTTWLYETSGKLITAGHILGENNPSKEVDIQFPGDSIRRARKINWGYQKEMGIDFAILSIDDYENSRSPLPIMLKTEVAGKLIAKGYGVTLKDQSDGNGLFIGDHKPQDCVNYRLFKLDSKELGEQGYSGAALYSMDDEAVVAIQTEATIAKTGAQRDLVLAMPLYRIAHFVKDLNKSLKKNRAEIHQAIPTTRLKKISEIFGSKIDDIKCLPCRNNCTHKSCQVEALCLISELLRNDTAISETTKFLIHYTELWPILVQLATLLNDRSADFFDIKSEYERLRRKLDLLYGFFKNLNRPYTGDESWEQYPQSRLRSFIKLRVQKLPTTEKDLIVQSFDRIYETLQDLNYSPDYEDEILRKLQSSPFKDSIGHLIDNFQSVQSLLQILATERRNKTRESISNSLFNTNSEHFHECISLCNSSLPHQNGDLPPIWKEH